MKSITSFALLFLISCTGAENKEKSGMAGVYKMLFQNMHNENTDTTLLDLQQLKIFTEHYMMYANFNPKDSVSSFGIGTYTMSNDTIYEEVFYRANDTTINNNLGRFTLAIEKTAKGYKQVVPNIQSAGQYFTLTEEYHSTGSNKKSSLDGAWRQVKFYSITGHDTITNTPTQYKIFYKGYVIWGHVTTDSLFKNHAAIGYGSFEMPSENKIKESMMVSTYYQIRSHDFDIDIEMNGPDEYKQTIHNADGSRSVEIYKRMKV